MPIGGDGRPRGKAYHETKCGEAWDEILDEDTLMVSGAQRRGRPSMERKGPCLYVCTDGSRRACAVGDCPCLVSTLGGPGETSGPRIDRIPPTRPPRWRRQFRELKKLIFSAPSKCLIDLFGPVANGTILKRLHDVPSLLASVFHAASCRFWPATFWVAVTAGIAWTAAAETDLHHYTAA